MMLGSKFALLYAVSTVVILLADNVRAAPGPGSSCGRDDDCAEGLSCWCADDKFAPLQGDGGVKISEYDSLTDPEDFGGRKVRGRNLAWMPEDHKNSCEVEGKQIGICTIDCDKADVACSDCGIPFGPAPGAKCCDTDTDYTERVCNCEDEGSQYLNCEDGCGITEGGDVNAGLPCCFPIEESVSALKKKKDDEVVLGASTCSSCMDLIGLKCEDCTAQQIGLEVFPVPCCAPFVPMPIRKTRDRRLSEVLGKGKNDEFYEPSLCNEEYILGCEG